MTNDNPTARYVDIFRGHLMQAEGLGRAEVVLLKLCLLAVCACDADPSSSHDGLQSQPPPRTSTLEPSRAPSPTPAVSASVLDASGTLPANPTSETPQPTSSPTSGDSGNATASSSLEELTDPIASSNAPSGASSNRADASAAPIPDRATEVCQRWNEDRADTSEGTWSGNVEQCDAGDVTSPGRQNALKLVNLYRYLAHMPAVEMDPERNQRAQQCALMQSANGLSHEPPMSWKCYTEVGAEASGVSSISSGRGVLSIDLYMTDGESNADTMGHRRWVFANSLGPVGFGSATSSCFYQADGDGDARKPFVAWPPPGPVPLQAILTTDVDTAGWTIQSDTFDLEDATVSVDRAGQPLAVTQSTLPGGYGSRYALRLVPTAWTLEAGHSYHVAVAGTEIDYTVDVVDCAN